MNQSELMRRELARNAGITLDDPKPQPVAVADDATWQREVSVEERELSRDVLVEAGAQATDLDWLVASCPSVEHALTYEPPLPVAYCARCQLPRVCDAGGCLVCRAVVPEGDDKTTTGRRRDL